MDALISIMDALPVTIVRVVEATTFVAAAIVLGFGLMAGARLYVMIFGPLPLLTARRDGDAGEPWTRTSDSEERGS